MASLAPSRTVPIALLYQAPTLHQHLKKALSELGARVVYDTPAAEFDRGALDRSGAEVIVINLDPDVDEEFEQLGDLLADEALKVIFNDGEVSSRLEGWDQARWARHLAAKILGLEDTNPPRPVGSTAIPVKVRSAAPEYPGAPEVDGSFELHGHELERALSADTGEAISLTRAALVTKDEPVAAELVPRPDPKEAPTLELPVGELVREIPQWQSEAPAPAAAAPAAPAPPPARAPAPPAVAAEFEAVLRDFGFLNEPEAAAPARAAAPDDDFADLGMALEPVTGSDDATAAPFDELSLDDARPAAPADEVPAFAAAAPEPIDELTLESFDAAPATEGASLSDLDLGAIELEPFDESGSGSTFGQVPEAAAPQGLDDFLFELSLEEAEKADKEGKAAAAPQKPQPVEKPAPKRHDALRATPTVAGKVLSATRPAEADEAKPAAPARPAPAAKPEEAPAPAAAAAPRKFDFSGLSLEPTEEERFAAPVTGRATYRIDESERKPVAPPLPSIAPAPPASQPVADDDEFSLGALEFSLDESTPITSDSVVRGAPVESEEMPDVMAELEAVVGPPAPAATAAVDGPIKRVWVLGASIGGPEAVREFLGAIEPGVPALFLLAQHMGSDFVELMTQQLARATKLNVRNVVSGDRVAYGDVVVVPLSERIHVDAQGVVKTTALDGMSPYSPSIDQVLMDVADRFGANAGAIVFSGMAHDAIDGSVYLSQKGGKVWAQDPATCVISSMVDGARDAGVVTFTGSPAELARQFQIEMFRAG
jgi:chemotaxis response regulator CheB